MLMADNYRGDRLQRKLGLFSLTNIVIANMIGAGIFTTSGLIIGILENPLLMIFLWLGGGIIAISGALCYGELGSAFPYAGGEYLYLSRLFHPVIGFLSGWVSFFVGFSAPIAASAIGFSEYLFRVFPELFKIGLFNENIEILIFKKLISVSVILIFTFVHLRGIEFGAGVQNFLTLLKICLILALLVAGFLSGNGSMENLISTGNFKFDFSGFKSIGLALMWIMFSYSGWNASSYIGSEIKKPSRNLSLSLILGTGIVLVLYLSLNLLYIYAIPSEKMKGVISIGGLTAKNLLGKTFESYFSLLIAFALFSSLSAFIILGPRVYYSMAKDGLFFNFASYVHPKFKVPSKSIILQSLIAIIILLTGTFEQILTYMGFSLGIFPVLAVAGVFKLRKRNLSSYKIPGYPVIPVFYILTAVFILIFGFLKSPIPSTIAIFTVLAGIPAYFIFKRRKVNEKI